MEKLENYTFESSDGHSIIHCVKWLPDREPVGVVQLVHGMVEYIESAHSIEVDFPTTNPEKEEE